MEPNKSEEIKPDFCFTVSFDKGAKNPDKIFRGISDIIGAFSKIDAVLLESINTEIKPITILEDIQQGSIRVWLANQIESIPDEHLGDLDYKKIIGHFLKKAKPIIVKFLEGKTEIKTAEQVQELTDNYNKLLKDPEYKALTSKESFTQKKTVEILKTMHESTKNFRDTNSKISFSDSTNTDRPLNASFQIAPEALEAVITKETTESQGLRILKVKKPDFLGDSQWEFRHGSTRIFAKINDADWLRKYQNGEHQIQPGDGLHCNVNHILTYDSEGELITEKYEILHIESIVKRHELQGDQKTDPPNNSIEA
jgi:hypothetical protein